MKQKDMVHTANMMTLPAIFSYSVALYMALIITIILLTLSIDDLKGFN